MARLGPIMDGGIKYRSTEQDSTCHIRLTHMIRRGFPSLQNGCELAEALEVVAVVRHHVYTALADYYLSAL